MSDPSYRALAAAILVTHQQTSSSGCLCGRLRLGESWARHVAEVLDAVGALQVVPAHRKDHQATAGAEVDA